MKTNQNRLSKKYKLQFNKAELLKQTNPLYREYYGR